MELLLAIDAGTTAMKAAVFRADGEMLAIDRQEYCLEIPGPAMVELNPEIYWQACRRAVRSALAQAQARPEAVRAVCISSQGETIIPVDSTGQPTHNAIVWLDNRAYDEALTLTQQFGIEAVQSVSGQTEISPIWPACKVLWLKRNLPDVFARTARFLLVEDYLLFRLTGQYVANLSVHSSSLFVDIVARQWWTPMFDFLDLTPAYFGRLVEPGEIIGPLRSESAEELGLTTSTLAVSGGLDQTIGALGAGNCVPGLLSETTGSALAMIVTLPAPSFDPLRRAPCFYHSIPGTYTLMPWCQTAGMALRWFRDQFYAIETQASGTDGYARMSEDASAVAPGSDGLVVLPHLEGASCPELNPSARGVFFGATLRHTRAHFVRAIMESVAFMLKRNIAILETLGSPVREIRSIGGGARSQVWLQIKADVLQTPVLTVSNEEAACLGASLTAAVAIGLTPNLTVGISQMVRVRQTIEPRPEHAAVYQAAYARYIECYDRLAPMFV